MIHKHVLEGCRPTPLAHYLKALGILRLVSQQKDKNCRGAWIDDRFVLATTLTREELEMFFLEEYRPTVMLAPWNGASGFFRTWDEKTKKLRNSKNGEALDSIVSRTGDRWENWRASYLHTAKKIAEVAKYVDISTISLKDRKELLVVPIESAGTFPVIDKDEGKLEIQRIMTQEYSRNPFYSSVLTSTNDGFKCPWLWGSGGNDGAMDFTARYMENIIKVLPEDGRPTIELLEAALYNQLTQGLLTGGPGKVGQFYPGAAGGANCTVGFGGQDSTHLNPWDFVLMLEGAVLFASAGTKRTNSQAGVQASAPFALRNQAAGGSVLSDSEESARGEQWMPLWDRFLMCQELQTLLAEGRAQIGRFHASSPVDMARSIARLGVARGIASFQRFGYLERNGRTNFAVPLDRVNVCERPRARLIDELAPWLDRLHRDARDKAPARLVQAERRLSDAVFAALTHDDSPRLWEAILLAAVEIESIQATGVAISCGPIPRLSSEWVWACLGDTCGSDVRLAVALGSAAGAYGIDGKAYDRIRHHWLPLTKFGDRYATSEKRLVHDVRVVAHGRDPETDLISVLARRVVESGKANQRHPSLVAAPGAEAHLADLAAWMDGRVDAERCLGLARAFMAVDWKQWSQKKHRLPPPADRDLPDDAWMTLKLNALPSALDTERDIPFDPAILRWLESGDGSQALQLALCRLSAHGIRPVLSCGLIDPLLARRFASALAFPISYKTSQFLLNRIQPTPKENSHAR